MEGERAGWRQTLNVGQRNVMTSPLVDSFFARPVATVARALIGCTLTLDGVGGAIVETEAYHHSDPASHSFRGPTPRNAVMFGPPGRVYVYRSYGMHWCANIVAGEEPGGAVLLRALAPTHGVATMGVRRGVEDGRLLCSGPGRLTQALGLTLAHNGLPATALPFALTDRDAPVSIVVGPRIGISKALERPWRFGLSGSPHLSRRFPALSAAAAPPADKV